MFCSKKKFCGSKGSNKAIFLMAHQGDAWVMPVTGPVVDPKVVTFYLIWWLKPMGFACEGVWGMAYCGPMGHGM